MDGPARQARLDDIKRRLARSESTYQIARAHGVSRERIGAILRANNLQPTYEMARVARRRQDDAAIVKFVQSNPFMSYRRVARETGTTSGQVSAVVRENGLEWMKLPITERGLRDFDYRIDDERGCWIWQGARHHGRPVVNSGRNGGRPVYANRVVYEQLVAPVPEGYQVRRRCRNLGCVNPEHLQLVWTRTAATLA